MFDLINANAEYQVNTKLFLKNSFDDNITDVLRLYLEQIQDLDCFKIARFVNLDSSIAIYCQWLYLYHNLHNDYETYFELFTNTKFEIIKTSSPEVIREYNKKFYTIIYPKTLIYFKENLDSVRSNLTTKYPFLIQSLGNIDSLIFAYETNKALAIFQKLPKSYLIQAKYSNSYLKIGLPILLGYKKEFDSTENNPNKKPFDWKVLEEFLYSLCLIHHIQNDDSLITQILLNNLTPEQKLAFGDNTLEDEGLTNIDLIKEKSQILKKLYIKAKRDLDCLVIEDYIDENKYTTLENLLDWSFDYQDSE